MADFEPDVFQSLNRPTCTKRLWRLFVKHALDVVHGHHRHERSLIEAIEQRIARRCTSTSIIHITYLGAVGTAPGDRFLASGPLPIVCLEHATYITSDRRDGAVDATRSDVNHSDGTCHIFMFQNPDFKGSFARQ